MGTKQGVKLPSQAIFGYHVYRVLGIQIAKLLYRTPITPNHVTTFSLLLSFFSAFLFLGGTHKYLIFGAIVFYFSKLLDYSDGQLARMRDIVSTFGHWYDGYTDIYKIFIQFLAIGVGQYILTDDFMFITLAFLSTILFLLFMITRLHQMVILGKKLFVEWQITRKTHFGWTNPSSIIIVIFALFNQPYYMLLFFSTFGALPLLIKIYMAYTSIKKNNQKLE